MPENIQDFYNLGTAKLINRLNQVAILGGFGCAIHRESRDAATDIYRTDPDGVNQ